MYEGKEGKMELCVKYSHYSNKQKNYTETKDLKGGQVLIQKYSLLLILCEGNGNRNNSGGNVTGIIQRGNRIHSFHRQKPTALYAFTEKIAI